MEQLLVAVPTELKEKVREQAYVTKVSQAAVVREALLKYFEDKE